MVRTVDLRHVLLVLPFIMDGLLDDAVLAEHNRTHTLTLRPVFDPSCELVGITVLFIQWYMALLHAAELKNRDADHHWTSQQVCPAFPHSREKMKSCLENSSV